MLISSYCSLFIFLILVNGLQASSLPNSNNQCAASKGTVISDFLKASYVLDSIKVANNSTHFLGTVRISSMEYFDFYLPVSPNYDLRTNYDLYRRWAQTANSAAADVLLRSTVMPSLHLCLRACSKTPACESLIYNRDKTECHILRDNNFLSREIYDNKITGFDREVDLVEPKELYFATKKCVVRSPGEECEEPKWSSHRNVHHSFLANSIDHFPSIEEWIYDVLNNICMEKGAQLCTDNKIFNCNLIIGNDRHNCNIPKESTVFTYKCNGSTIETLVQKIFPEIGDSIKFENDKLTLPVCSDSVRQDCIYIELPVADEPPTWYWVPPVVITILLILVGVPILWFWIWHLTKEGKTNFRGGNNLSESRIRRLAQIYLSSENRIHQLPTTQIREDTNDHRLTAVIQVYSLSTENHNLNGRDDPPSYDEVCCADGVVHAEEESPPGYHSLVTNESNRRNPFLYTIS